MSPDTGTEPTVVLHATDQLHGGALSKSQNRAKINSAWKAKRKLIPSAVVAAAANQLTALAAATVFFQPTALAASILAQLLR
jgi:hypothetical protein